MIDCEKAVREFFHKRGADNAYTRTLICTPVLADYQIVSHWVICLEGSPPRGTLIVRPEYWTMRFELGGRVRKYDVFPMLKNFVGVFLTKPNDRAKICRYSAYTIPVVISVEVKRVPYFTDVPHILYFSNDDGEIAWQAQLNNLQNAT